MLVRKTNIEHQNPRDQRVNFGELFHNLHSQFSFHATLRATSKQILQYSTACSNTRKNPILKYHFCRIVYMIYIYVSFIYEKMNYV